VVEVGFVQRWRNLFQLLWLHDDETSPWRRVRFRFWIHGQLVDVEREKQAFFG
jgi:hypothetical protein